MSAQDLIAALQGDGRVDAEGSFTLHREKAREKLRTFQVAEPQKYVLHLIALAALKRATEVHVRCDSDDVVVRFDGVPVTAADLDDLYGSSFAAASNDVQRARQQLAVAIHAALALNPKFVRVVSGTGASAVSMVARHGAPDEIGGAVAGAPEGTEIHVKQRFRPGLMVRFVQHLRGGLAEATWLRERCRFSPRKIWLNGESIAGGLQILGADHVVEEVDGPSRGVAGLVMDSVDAAVIRLVRHGVWLHDEPAPHLPQGFVAVIADDLLRTDLSGDRVVQDPSHARCLRLADALAMAVVDAAVGRHEAELVPWVAARLGPVWRLWDAATRANTRVGAALGRVVRWPDIFGRRHSLLRLRTIVAERGHLPVTYARFAERLVVDDEIVVQLEEVNLEDVAVLQRMFPDALRDVTDVLERRAQVEANRRRWRAQPSDGKLVAASYHRVAPFVVQLGGVAVTGEAGLRRAVGTTCTLSVVVDGCLLAELELDAPIAGVDAVICGALPVLADGSGPVRGDLLAACIGGWLATARVLAEVGLTRGLVVGPAIVHGYLRATFRGEALRASLQAAGFETEALMRHLGQLLRSLPPHALPDGVHQHAWLRGVYTFTTVGGETLGVAEVASLLQHGVAVRWVPDTFETRAGMSEPVLRVAAREAEALRWLFAGKVPRMEADAYAALLARARHMARPVMQAWLSEQTCTPHVEVVSDGLQVAVAFARTLAQWAAHETKGRAPCQVIVHGRALCTTWVWSPIAGVCLAMAGEGFTVKPTWDDVVLDDVYAAAARTAAAAVPHLVPAAIAGLAGEQDRGLRAVWQRGLVAALTATFPTPALRWAYAALVARFGRVEAERHYLRLLAFQQAVPLAKLDELAQQVADDTVITADVHALAERLGVAPRSQVDVDALGAVLADLRAALGQVGGDSWLVDVGCSSPAVAALPLLRLASGAWATLADVKAQIAGRGVHVVVDPDDCAWPHAGRKARLADEPTRRVLQQLFAAAQLQIAGSIDEPASAGTADDLLRLMAGLSERMTAPAGNTAAISALIRAAIAGSAWTTGDADKWRRGLLLALGATFPRPALRVKYERWLAEHGPAVAEQAYCGLLAQAQKHGLDAPLEAFAERTEADDLDELARLFRPSAAATAIQGMLAALRGALGQVGGTSLIDAVRCFAPEVGALQLFVQIDGTAVTLAEVAAAAANGVVHVFTGAAAQERPRAYWRSLRATQADVDVLTALFGSARIGTVAPPEDPRAPTKRHAQRDLLREVNEQAAAAADTSWKALLELDRLRADEDRTPATPPVVSAVDEALDRLFPAPGPGHGAGPVTTSRPPPPPPEPTAADRMIAAIQGELHALRRGHEALLTGFNLDHMRAWSGSGKQAVRCDHDGVVLDTRHPQIAAAIAGWADDRVWIWFLVSQVYTALNVWREDISDADEQAFHVRQLEWVHAQLRGRG